VPGTVYELISLKGELPEQTRRLVQHYEEALGHYREARFDDAERALGLALALDPSDGPSKTLVNKCRKARVLPTGTPFDPVASLEK
jgi:adenylate cyclase